MDLLKMWLHYEYNLPRFFVACFVDRAVIRTTAVVTCRMTIKTIAAAVTSETNKVWKTITLIMI